MDETTKPEAVSSITVEPVTDTKKDSIENLVIETYEPKKNCRKCHGTGRIGFVEGDPNKPYYCNCIMKVKKTLTPEQMAIVAKAGVVIPEAPKVEAKPDEPKTSI